MEDRQETEIQALNRRVEALEVLVRLGYPFQDGYVDVKTLGWAQARVAVVKPNVTQKIKQIMTAFEGPFTSGELREKLLQLGWTFTAESNPWALIHTICRNLIRQGFARQVFKGEHRAWERVPVADAKISTNG